jgi:diacylglycerol kinase (ATP)
VGRRLPQLRVQVDGRTHLCSFALVTKVKNYGGDFEIARHVTLLDDQFEVVLFEGPSSMSYVKYVVGMALNRLAGMKGITILRASRVVVSNVEDDRAYAQVDGEFAGHLPAEIRIVPQALTLLAPRELGK